MKRKPPARKAARSPIRIFVSYSHVDRKWFSELRPLLIFDDQPTTVAHVWHDNELTAGDRWDKVIRDELERMDVFLCLLSYQFRASSYIRTVEQSAAFEREKQGKTVIVPLVLCDMDHRDLAEYKSFNPLPAWGRSWLSYKQEGDVSLAHKPIRTGLLDVLDQVRKRRTGGRRA